MPRQPQLDERALNRLGVTPVRLRAIQTAPNLQRAEELLNQLKEDTRQAFKRLSLDIHPDRHQDETEEKLVKRTREMQSLQAMRDWVTNLKVHIQPRRQVFVPVRIVRVSPGTFWSSASSTATTNTTTTFGWTTSTCWSGSVSGTGNGWFR